MDWLARIAAEPGHVAMNEHPAGAVASADRLARA
jgi:hypothetical protein